LNSKTYYKLAKHLDKLPGGFPSTKTGVEIRILKRFFSLEQAKLATKLTLIPERAEIIARRFGLNPRECITRLEEMSKHGLIFSFQQKGHKLYMAAQFIIGIWEYHVNNLDTQLITDMHEYIPHLINFQVWKKSPQLRIIPVELSISSELKIMPYEQAKIIIKRQKYIVVAPCICRREHKIIGKGCKKPEKNCLVFGAGALYYQHNKLGQLITQNEALKIIEEADAVGLVLQPSNAQKVINICCCCGCCCQILKNIKRYPKPIEIIASPFIISFKKETCTNCGICVTRCQMQSLTQSNDKKKIKLNLKNCIGCGLCVSTCPSKSLSLKRKRQKQSVPKNVMENYLRLGKIRGKIKFYNLIWMQLKSKIDRLLTRV